MSEEPAFDVTLKKKKKKAVAFNEDPLGVEGGADAPTFVRRTKLSIICAVMKMARR